MLCRDIHEPDYNCGQEIPDDSWKFCPRCGRSTGHIVTPSGIVSLANNSAATRQMDLRNKGLSSVAVSVSLDEDDSVKFGEGQKLDFTVRNGELAPVKLRFPALDVSKKMGWLRIEAKDAPLDPPGPDPHEWLWQERKRRLIRVRLEAKVDTHRVIRPVQEIAIFSKGITERTLIVRGVPGTAKHLLDIDWPAGYEVEADEKTKVSSDEAAFTIKRDWRIQAHPDSELTIKTSDPKLHKVLLYSPLGEKFSGPLPDAIIGIDFGTAFSTVVFRQCRRRPNQEDDPVEFLRPPGEIKDRFPTRLWIGKNGERKYGSLATEKFNEDEREGYLFRQIKTLLREPNMAERMIDLKTYSSEALEYVTRKHGAQWPQALVTSYLKWLYDETIMPKLRRSYGETDVTVWYVFSLPVLDFKMNTTGDEEQAGQLYSLQKTQMEKCIQDAGFEGRIDFQFEPVCAAMGLLYPHENAWPRLGTKNRGIETGREVAVFDSGGGTTDVVLMRAEVDGDSRVFLTVENCLGLDARSATFGGEEVTDKFIEALEDPTTVVMKRGSTEKWYEGELNADMILHDEGKLDRDVAEELKIKLSVQGSKGVRCNADQTTLRPVVLERLVLKPLYDLADALDERVFAHVDRAATHYYLCVGGNTYLDPVSQWIGIFMHDENASAIGRRLVLPEKYRMLAVAYGAVWVPDARIKNAVPYDVELLDEDKTLLTFRRNTSQESYNKRHRFPMLPQSFKKFVLKAAVNGTSYCVAEAAVENSETSDDIDLFLWTSVQNGIVSLVYVLHDVKAAEEPKKEDGKELLKYRL